jgi:hypothetical protein
MRQKVHWRTISLSLVGACLLIVASLSGTGAQPNTSGNRATSAPRVYTPTRRAGKLAGIVDLAKTPKLTSNSQTPATSAPIITTAPLTPEQRQASPQVKNPHPNTRSGDGKSPAFVGGGVTPLVTKNVDGLTGPQSGGSFNFPDPAIATDLSYVMEGVNGAIAIYRASTGALQFGPYATSSFFAPVYSSGDTFYNGQMYYDVMRDRWVVSYLQFTGGLTGVTYLDIAISVSNSPTQPNPGGQYYIYQLDTNFTANVVPDFCYRMTMGADYWGLYFACRNVNSQGHTFMGNTTLALGKTPAYSGGTAFSWYVNNALLVGGGGTVALAVSAAIEEGVQDAEFFISTDVDVNLGVRSNMGLCAWTNLNNMTNTTAPTITCQDVDLGLPYSYPDVAQQPGGPVLQSDIGPKQVYYKAGRLYFAQTTLLNDNNGHHEGIYWAEVQPQLTTKAAHTPQWVNGAIVRQVAYFDFGSTYDLFNPTLMGTDEGDITLVYNMSGSTLYPRIEMTGRKATDAPNTLGQGGYYVLIANGAHTRTMSAFGENSSCAIPLNSVTRGTIWCAAQYAGSVPSPGWNTRLFSFRTE